MAKLTARKVQSLKTPGRYGDGDGLYLVVQRSLSKSWILRTVINGRRTDKGLGGYPAVSLADARRNMRELREALRTGRRRKPAPTFRQAAERYVDDYSPTWRNPRTAANTLSRFNLYAYPAFGNVPVDRIGRADVLEVLRPIWSAKPVASQKLRQHVRAVFDYALANDYIDENATNPAGEVINSGLPRRRHVTRHFLSLPYQEIPEALESVDALAANLVSKLCFRFLVLTAARSGEARGAKWSEIDLETATWTIPGERMKAGDEHRVPLSRQALDVLIKAWQLGDGSGLVFPSAVKPGRQLSDMTLTKILRSTGLAAKATVHGFRTSFRTWTLEQTDTPWAVGEAALAHRLGNTTEQAYARSDVFERRRDLMQSWADSLDRTPAGKVVQFTATG